MKHIPLSHGKTALVDDSDYDYLAVYKWHATQNAEKGGWYAARNVSHADGTRNKVRMHRVIMGVTDPRVQIDHEDGDGLNNQRSNLRVATNATNQRNRSVNKRGTVTGYKGVQFYPRRTFPKKYGARIYLNNKPLSLGSYTTAEEAARAYDTKAKELFGSFARLNFSEGVSA